MQSRNHNSPITTLWGMLVLAGLALVVWWLSQHLVWINDDVYFRFYIGGERSQLIQSWSDIVGSQWNYYLTRCGRMATHCVVQALCSFAGGQAAFAILNAVAWVALVLLVLRLGGTPLRGSWLAVPGTAALTFVSFRTQFSPPCQVNYIWAMAAGLLVLVIYRDTRRHPAAITAAMILLCLLAGWGQESYSPGIAAALWLHALTHRATTTSRQWAMLVAFTVGVLGLCLAPGNVINFDNHSVKPQGGYWITLVNIVWLLRATYVMLAVMVLAWLQGITPWRVYRDNAVLFNAMAAMLAFNLVVRVYCNRQLFGIDLMAMIITLRVLRQLRLSLMVRTAAVTAISAVAAMVALTDVTTVTRRNTIYHDIERQYRLSTDGTAYIDIPYRDIGYDDHDAMYTFNDWTREQLDRAFTARWGEGKNLQWLPPVLQELHGQHTSSRVIRTENDMLVLIAADTDSVPAVFQSTMVSHYGMLTVTGSAWHDSRHFPIHDVHWSALPLRQQSALHIYTDARLINEQDPAASLQTGSQ